jgi:RimJ/RimL family protein N-acetyltransferase
VTPRAPDRIETARLVLRRPSAADAAAIFARYANDAEATRYLGWRRHSTVDDTKMFLAFSEAEWARWPAGPYIVESRENGVLLGSTGLAFESFESAMTGYVFARDAWGQGYATEALSAIVPLAPELRIHRLYAICHTEHRASARVLEKCGFAREGVLPRHTVFPNLMPGKAADVFCYSRHF